MVRVAVAALTVAGLAGAGVAQARDMHGWSKDRGAHAFSIGTNGAIAIEDRKGDGNYVFANYYRSGHSNMYRLENGNGVGTRVTSATDYSHPVRTLRACTNYSFSPDDCGDWQ